MQNSFLFSVFYFFLHQLFLFYIKFNWKKSVVVEMMYLNKFTAAKYMHEKNQLITNLK